MSSVSDRPTDPPGPIDAVLTRMAGLAVPLEESGDPLRHFLATYSRTTAAVGAAVRAGRFEDPTWVEAWDVAFADLYVEALEAFRDDPASAPRPWRLAFTARAELAPLTHVLLGINAHVNYDLPQALLAVIPPADFADPDLIARRRRDHERIDGVLSERVAAEDAELEQVESGPRRVVDRLLMPANRYASKRFLRESREKVWHNTEALHAARTAGDGAYRRRLAELDVLSSARIADLLRPGKVLLRLATAGFGVLLPPE
jgi:hypothetical protein